MSEMNQFTNTVQKSAVGAGITGVCAGLGGLAAGPVGMAVGGAVGGVLSAIIMEFNSDPDVIRYHFSPPEWLELMEKAKQGLANLRELAFKLFFRILNEFRNFKSLEDFKRAVLEPLIEELACSGVEYLVKLITFTFY